MASIQHVGHGWTREAAERAVTAAKKYELDFIEIALLQPAADAGHKRKLHEDNHLQAGPRLRIVAGLKSEVLTNSS